MGYPVPANSPKILINGRTIVVAAFDWSTPMGQMYKAGIYEQSPSGEWLELQSVAIYANPGDCLADMQAKGGSVKYMIWLKNAINVALAKLFAAPAPPPVGEPTTDVQAKAYISAGVMTWVIDNIGGIPTVR